MQARIDPRAAARLVHRDFNVSAVPSSDGSFPFVFKRVCYSETQASNSLEPKSRHIMELKGVTHKADDKEDVATYVVTDEKQFLESVRMHLDAKKQPVEQAIAKLKQQIKILEGESAEITALSKLIGFQEVIALESKGQSSESGFFSHAAAQPAAPVVKLLSPAPATFCALLGILLNKNDITQKADSFNFRFTTEANALLKYGAEYGTYHEFLKNIAKLNGVNLTVQHVPHERKSKPPRRGARFGKEVTAYDEHLFTITVADKEFFIESLLRATNFANAFPATEETFKMLSSTEKSEREPSSRVLGRLG